MRRGHTNCCENHQTLGVHVDGGLRPLFTVPARKLHVSTKLSYEQLALVETLGIGLHAINRANPRADETVLVIGRGSDRSLGRRVRPSSPARGSSSWT